MAVNVEDGKTLRVLASIYKPADGAVTARWVSIDS
jgi:hypothetical protein